MKTVNETIGYVICPFSGQRSEVRRNKNNKLYYVGEGGQITPNRPAGQAWLENNMELLPDQAKEELNQAPLEFGMRILPEEKEPEKSEVSIQPVEEKKERDSWTII